MNFSELVQLYVPLAGLAAMAFWVGALSERVKNLREDVKGLQSETMVSASPAVIRLEEKMIAVIASIDKLTRGMDHVQRQLGNLMQKDAHSVIELHGGRD